MEDQSFIRNRWLFAVVAALAVVVVVNMYFLYVALDSQTDLVTSQPYEDGLKYENVISEERYASELGVKLQVKVSSVPSSSTRTIELQLSGMKAELAPQEVELVLTRPSDSRLDEAHKLSQHSEGRLSYQGEVRLPLKGLWFLTARAKVGSQWFRVKKKLFV